MENDKPLNAVNAHVLDTVLSAGRERAVVASRDIFDDKGVKLLAQHKPITAVLQERLLGRTLRVPLEASLRFEASVDRAELRSAFTQLLDSGHALAGLVRQWAQPVDAQLVGLPLDPVVQFLLTAMQTTLPKAFEHAVQAMALAGAMATRAGDNAGDIRLAMVAGLLHDIGELYLPAELRGDGSDLDLQHYRALVTHPQLGELLLSGLPLYPQAVSRAVGEHHERLDGSGYAGMRSGAALSRLGRVLSVVETTLGVLGGPDASLARASFALRVVPGEYEGHWTGLVASVAVATPSAQSVDSAQVARAWDGLGSSRLCMERAREQAVLLASGSTASVRAVAQRAVHLLDKLRAGWNEMGLWMPAPAQGAGALELVMADEELRYRLSVLERNCVWQADDLDAVQAQQLAPLWQGLVAQTAG